MNFKYNSSADALYLSLIKNSSIKRTEEKDGFIIDYDYSNEVVGIEILGAHRFLSGKTPSSIPLETVL